MPPRLAIRSLLAGCLLLAFATSSRAEDEEGVSFTAGPLDLTATFEAGAGAFMVRNAQFGLGSTSRTGTRAGGRTWFEGFVKPGVRAQWAAEDESVLYGRVSAVAAATRGQGEAGAPSLTSDQPEHASLEDAFVGWRSGALLEGLPSHALDLSIGNQDFTIGDGFLIATGTANGGGRGAFYLGPRVAFEKTAIARVDTEPVRADVFHLAGAVDQSLMYGNDNPATKLIGANVEWFASRDGDQGRFDYLERQWYAGLTLLKIYGADRTFSFNGSQGGAAIGANRDGLSVASARFGGSFIPGFEDFAVFGEYGIERNGAGANGGSVRANAWYLQPQYIFSDLPWQPLTTVRYAHFSGDANTNDRVDRSWDPLFSDYGPRGTNVWTQGAIYAQYVGSNSNLNSWYMGAQVQPIEDELTIGLAFYRHAFDEPGAGRSSHLMDEIDLSAEWQTPIPGVTLSPVLAAGRSGAGQRQALELSKTDSRTIWLGHIVLSYRL